MLFLSVMDRSRLVAKCLTTTMFSSLKVRRKSAAWDVNYLESLLRQTA